MHHPAGVLTERGHKTKMTDFRHFCFWSMTIKRTGTAAASAAILLRRRTASAVGVFLAFGPLTAKPGAPCCGSSTKSYRRAGVGSQWKFDRPPI
ncbi:hypothetical protein [Candidatus Villigracilis saccharophilus]|uniref:hypothetical protein n=1 Tax=Candidatus Villigracilis saccharophilus TaxID=3140684 RepID=UPI003134FAD1|nr:hypothetical protein [Anaerolineales bacterium]